MFKALKERLYFLKVWKAQLLDYPRATVSLENDYDAYWDARGSKMELSLNSWQKERASFVLEKLRRFPQVSVLDIGCGDGSFLAYLKHKGHSGNLSGVDVSIRALEVAKHFGINAQTLDFAADPIILQSLPSADFVLLLEVLEHMPNSELLLAEAYKKAEKGVFFSIPNTGYFIFRLRLLFGKTPMQWRVHPGEHLRFWTKTDLVWWLNALGYKNYEVVGYKGVPLLNALWPALFAGGLIVYLHKSS